MVDLRVDVVGSACQHNAAAALFLHLTKDTGSLFHNVCLGLSLLLPGQVHGRPCLGGRNAPLLFADFDQPVRSSLFTGKGHKGADVAHLPLCNRLYIVFQVLRVGGDNGTAVMILRVLVFLVFIENTGVKNGGNTLLYQPLHMAVG